MKQFLKILFRFLSPSMGFILLLTPLSGAALIFALTSELHATPAGFAASMVLYLISAYTLAALIIGIPRFRAAVKTFLAENKIVAKIRTRLYENEYTGLYLKNLPVRVKVSLYVSLFVNLLYAALKMAAGIIYVSFWFGAEAVFYLVIGTVRYFILRNMQKNAGLRHEYQVYRFCGFLLFALNATLSGVVFQMIHQGGGNKYPGRLIFIVATCVFVYLGSSIVELIKYQKLNSPIISAAKIITFAGALVAIYSLQISLFAAFGENETLALIMNSVFGGLLCITIFGLAIFMVVRGFEQLKKMGETAKDAPIYHAKLIAHRGASKEKKQNTAAAFAQASQSGVYGVETDVRVTKDGVFVTFHDKSMARLSGRYKIIEKTNYKDVEKLKVYDRHMRHKVPTLLEFLQSCKVSGKAAVVEIKSNLTGEQTDELLKIIDGENYLPKTIFISFNRRVLQYIRARLPEQPIELLAIKYKQEELKYLQEFKFGIDILHRQLTKERINEYHEMGIAVNCWTVNSKRRAGRLREWGVDFITTDSPSLGEKK